MQTYIVKRGLYYEAWYLNDKFHNEFGPAEIYYYENGNIRIARYYLNGVQHRTDGPSVIWYYENGNIGNKNYFLNGEKCSKENFLSKTQQQSCDGKVVEIDGKQYKLTEV